MLQADTIQYNFRTIALLLLVCLTQIAIAQTADTMPATGNDSIVIIKELVKNYLEKQLQQCASYQKTGQGRLQQLLNDSVSVDSLSKIVLEQVQQFKTGAMHSTKTGVINAVQTSKKILHEQLIKLMQTAHIEGLINQFTGMIKKPPIQFKSGSIKIQGQIAPSWNGNTFINSNIIAGSWTIMGIPTGMQLMRQDFTGPEYYYRNTFSFQFDREAYLNSLRDKIKLKIRENDLLPDYNDVLQKSKEDVLMRLKLSLDSINSSYKGLLGRKIEQLGDPQSLLKVNVGDLQDRLLSAGFLQNIENKKNQLMQLQQQINMGNKTDAALYDSLLQSVQSVEGVNKIIDVIKSFKEGIQKSGLIEKLEQAEQFKDKNIQQWMQDPDKLKAIAKEQLGLTGIQKLFLNMNELKIGTNTVNLSPLTVYQYANSGVNATFINNGIYLFIMAGKHKQFSNLYDNRFVNPVFSMDNTGTGIRIGRGDITKNHTHLSLFSYKQHKSNYNGVSIDPVPGNTAVATFSNQLKFNDNNYLDLEISKSAHKYNNSQDVYDTLKQSSSLTKQLLGGGNFVQQMAFTLQWNGELREKEITYNLHGTRTGKGYTNPGSYFLSSGMTEFGGNIRKVFLHSQLQVSAKGNYREYEYGSNNTKWRNYNFSFQGKWKLKKSQYISLRYQPYQSLRWQDDKKYTVGGSSRLSLEGSFHKRTGKINYQHTISLSSVRNNYQFDSISADNNSILISSLQTITVNKKSYYLNMQFNKANTPSALMVFNTQLSADAGLMYSIFKGIMGSTALNYNSTKDWYQQVGIKQSFSGQVGQRCIISVYADIIKNIKEYRPNNMGVSRIDWSLQYLLK
ncbi:MAG: hypothetical protein ABJC98_22425 [Bacteroidota bacterium]